MTIGNDTASTCVDRMRSAEWALERQVAEYENLVRAVLGIDDDQDLPEDLDPADVCGLADQHRVAGGAGRLARAERLLRIFAAATPSRDEVENGWHVRGDRHRFSIGGLRGGLAVAHFEDARAFLGMGPVESEGGDHV